MGQSMKFTIKRIASTPEAVFGVMLFDGVPFALTAERPWLDNAPNISCIPEGSYSCKRIDSPQFGDTFEVLNVPDRTHILLHKGNVAAEDSKGCILIGEMFEPVHGQSAVQSSAKGYGEYKKIIEGLDQHFLVIENHF